ncbi:MAG: hypothetical protein RDU76_06180 [Candidatus Edwardsbacteria bacterium]|nr:hypothetical protein [Candidatus Edwardsbacteria bacterium]
MSINNEQEYWQMRSSQEQFHQELQHREQMNIAVATLDLINVKMLQPKIYIDGDMWCVLYGENLQDGIAGFGKTPFYAISDFNTALNKPVKETPCDKQ